jgi:hypothetical protein
MTFADNAIAHQGTGNIMGTTPVEIAMQAAAVMPAAMAVRAVQGGGQGDWWRREGRKEGRVLT